MFEMVQKLYRLSCCMLKMACARRALVSRAEEQVEEDEDDGERLEKPYM